LASRIGDGDNKSTIAKNGRALFNINEKRNHSRKTKLEVEHARFAGMTERGVT
jgi:hypothetical protein